MNFLIVNLSLPKWFLKLLITNFNKEITFSSTYMLISYVYILYDPRNFRSYKKQAKDITDIGSLREAAKFFVPGTC